MWRFFAAAFAIVVLVGSIAFGRRAAGPPLDISAKVTGTPTPTAERSTRDSGARPAATFAGSGSWTMSSLPECFRETRRADGSVAQLRAQFPSPADRLPPRTVVRSGNCTIAVGTHDLRITRSHDKLVVPPEAALYRDAGHLTLVFVHGSRAQIRRY